jgi:localization factor PodJL
MRRLHRAWLFGLALLLPGARAESLYSGMEDVVAQARALTPDTLPAVRAAAATGDLKAQLRLAFVYAEGGAGLAADDANAARWFESAAAGGEVFAQVMIATLYLEGKGVAQSGDKAMSWFRLAAEQGNPEAFFALGSLRVSGAPGINADAIEAYKWFSLGIDATSNEGKKRTMGDSLQRLEPLMDAAQLAVGRERASEWRAAHHLTSR